VTTTPDADRQARRDAIRDLITRIGHGRAGPDVATLLTGYLDAEQADADQAREQLAADPLLRMLDSPVVGVAALGAAAHEHAARMVREANERAEQAQQTARDARQGEAEAVRAREAAEAGERRAMEQRQQMAAERYAWQERGDRAERERDTARRDAAAARIRSGRHVTEARRNRDAWRNAHKRAASLGRQLADMTTDRDGWWARALELGETVGRRAERAEATLTAVRTAVADAKACPGDEYCTVDHRDIITNLIDNGPAALGDPQPATEPEAPPERCCVCGCPDVTYHNHRDQPFCCRCAKCCDPPKLCAHGCQPPTCPAQNTAMPDRVAHCDLPAHHDEDHRDSTVPGVLRWADDVAVYPAAEPEQAASALPVVTCGPVRTHAAHQHTVDGTTYRCPGLTATDLRAPATRSTTIFTLPNSTKTPEPEQPAEPPPTVSVIDTLAADLITAVRRAITTITKD
jgi:hypothetical protein